MLPFCARVCNVVLLAAALATAAQIPATQTPSAQESGATRFDPLKSRGTVVASVVCASDPSQSYALYLPSQYSPERRWPIIYAFGPGARGKNAVETYKEAAEKYGYIVAGSNNSKNGPMAPSVAAAEAVWQDTHARLAIDGKRVYVTGLSGGARFATTFALYCATCAVAGVIAHGAGYPQITAKPANESFAYYAAVGDADFNLPELLELRKKKDDQSTQVKDAQFKVKIYPGPHQWAPPAVVEDALEWLELKAMQTGTVKPDAAFVQRLLTQTQAEAAQAEQRGDTMTQYFALRSLAVDFKGLEDVSQFETRLAELKTSKAFRKAAQQERQEIEKQESLEAPVSADISRLAQMPPEEQSAITQRVVSVMTAMRKEAKSDRQDHALYARVLSGLFIQGVEAGQAEFRNKRFRQAADYFELMAQAAPDQPWPALLLAETRVRQGNKKAAMKALEEAVKRGLKRPETLTQDPELAPLAEEPEFKKIVEGLNQSPGGR
jgi:dienelactone hydrolase